MVEMRKQTKADLNNSRTGSAKAEAQTEKSIANKCTKKSIREDGRKFVNNLAE